MQLNITIETQSRNSLVFQKNYKTIKLKNLWVNYKKDKVKKSQLQLNSIQYTNKIYQNVRIDTQFKIFQELICSIIEKTGDNVGQKCDQSR